MKKIFLTILILASISFLTTQARMIQPSTFYEREESQTQDIKKTLPKPEFLFPKGREEISGKINFNFKVPQAERVEIYLRSPSSLTEIYLGELKKKGEDLFELDFDSTNIPNGQHYLFLKVFTPFGDYKSDEVLISVKNEIKPKEEKIEKVKKEVAPVSEILQKKEEEEEEIKKETARKIEETLKEETKEIPEVKQEIEATREKIKTKIEELKKIEEKEIKAQTEKASKEEIEKIKKEKEEKKEEIVKTATQVLEKAAEKKPEILPSKEKVEEKLKEIIQEAEVKLKEKAKEKGEISPLALKDSDFDGLSDWQEIRLGTDPFNPDTDNDGFLDGIEYKTGFDPKKPGPADKVLWQDPRKHGKISEQIFVEKVELISVEGKKKLSISGRGIPNSFITLYIFSEPIVAMVKVGEDGRWQYVLDKELADGTHIVYAALTNNRGEIEEKSSPYVFSKIGENVLRITEAQAQVAKEPLEVLQRSFLVLTVGLIVLALGISFFVISFLITRQKEEG